MATYSFYKENKQDEKVSETSTEAKKEYQRKVALVTAVVGVGVATTIAENVVTGGAGVADDIPSIVSVLKLASLVMG